MADRGILFSAPMVLALLEGRKTQTRRMINPQPCATSAAGKPVVQVADYCTGAPQHGQAYYWQADGTWNSSEAFKLPHRVGDRLYVRETWRPIEGYSDWDIRIHFAADDTIIHLADGECGDGNWNWPRAAVKGFVPSLHMPRWASRMWLLVTDVRVQRLKDITESDCIAEGPIIKGYAEFGRGQPSSLDGIMVHTDQEHVYATPRCWFRELWDSLHNKLGERWDDNPWLYALTFEVNHGNIDGGNK